MKIQLTRKEAARFNLLVCGCEHPRSNHFNHLRAKPCAHCDCKKYREVLRVGKKIK